MSKPQKIANYFKGTILLLTVVTTFIVASLLMLTEYVNFSHHKNEFKKNYINDQKKYIKYISENELENIINQKKRLEDEVYDEVKRYVSQAEKLALYLYKFHYRKKSEAEIKSIIIDAVMALQGDHPYSKVFITSMDGIGIAYPDHPDFTGSYLLYYRDEEGNLVVKKELALLKTATSGFITYDINNGTIAHGHPKRKISFVKNIGLFNWYFSSSEYLDNHYNDFEKEIASRISNVRFINGGYVFLNQINGTPLVLDGKVYEGNFNFLDGSDSMRMEVFKKEVIAATSSPNGGYFNYRWNKIGETDNVDKCSYAIEFKEWGWIVGAGFYLDDADIDMRLLFTDTRKEFFQKIFQLLIVLVFIILVEVYILNRFNKKIFSDFNAIFNFFKIAADTNQKLDESTLYFDEFKETALAANKMIKIKEKMYSDLLIQQEKAMESDRLKSAFLANMSHEIRTPMNAILGFSELLVDNGIDEKERKAHEELIQINGDKLLTLINDIIDLSKIEANQLEIKIESFNLYQFIQSSFIRNKAILEKLVKSNINFKLENEISKISLASSDPVRINQIIDNLLSNAFKFTNKGFVIYRARLNDNMLEIKISDSGIGIEQENIEHIYERFRQVENELQKEFSGTGLGLAITKNLVELLSGTIKIESELGTGTSFTVLIPIIFSQAL